MEQRPLQQVFVAEQALCQAVPILGVHVHLDGKQLLLIVPLVQSLALVQAFVALQPHQLPVKGGGHDLGHLRFSYACRTLNEQGATQLEGDEQHRGQGFVVNIMALVHFGFQFFIGHRVSSLIVFYKNIVS